jgi:hypothetical protein
MGKQNKLPVCEVILHKPFEAITAIDPVLGEHFYNLKKRCSIEVERLRFFNKELLKRLFSDTHLTLQGRVREHGGFKVIEGAAQVLCTSEGAPVAGSSARNPKAFGAALWYRVRNEPVYIVRSHADFIGGDGMAEECTGEKWDPKAKAAGLRGVWRREVPKEWRFFKADVNNLEQQLREGCLATEEKRLVNFSSETLKGAIEASFDKAQCVGCNHIHYGLLTLPPGVAQPERNRTRRSAIELIASYNAASGKWRKRFKPLK